MSSGDALLTFSIGPVHAFIAQARRVADLWTGSDLLSHLMGEAIREARDRGGEAIFPEVRPEDEPPRGLPNRVVCRVPEARAETVAMAMEERVRNRWNQLADDAVAILGKKGLRPAERIWSEVKGRPRQTDSVFQVAWSWVPETSGYAAAAREGARRYGASRLFRPFEPIAELDEKCAVCGERTALPDGDRQRVREAWEKVAEETEETREKRFFRSDQTRLCLVCATKRLYPWSQDPTRRAYFSGFEEFQPDDETAYFALVAMDGDRMGDILDGSVVEIAQDRMEEFHRTVSRRLNGFSESLRDLKPWQLELRELGLTRLAGKSPQLVYAGGEDVMVVCDPRDALPIARAIRERYLGELEQVRKLLSDPAQFDAAFTISAAVLFVHAKHPAGLAFHEVEDLLDRKAKAEAGRDAVALRLVKRGGVPVEVAFKWNEAPVDGGPTWVERFVELTRKLATRDLSSRQSYHLRQEEEVLMPVFAGDSGETEEVRRTRWQRWLADRLAKSEVSSKLADELAVELSPFFLAGRTEALRIARFLGVEIPALRAHQTDDEEEDR